MEGPRKRQSTKNSSQGCARLWDMTPDKSMAPMISKRWLTMMECMTKRPERTPNYRDELFIRMHHPHGALESTKNFPRRSTINSFIDILPRPGISELSLTKRPQRRQTITRNGPRCTYEQGMPGTAPNYRIMTHYHAVWYLRLRSQSTITVHYKETPVVR